MKKNKGLCTSVVRTIAILVTVMLSYQGVKLVRVSRNLDQQIKEAQKEVMAESKRLEELKLEYESIETLQNVEKVAREKLGLVKADEIVFREKY